MKLETFCKIKIIIKEVNDKELVINWHEKKYETIELIIDNKKTKVKILKSRVKNKKSCYNKKFK
jgi:hypothetical protein